MITTRRPHPVLVLPLLVVLAVAPPAGGLADGAGTGTPAKGALAPPVLQGTWIITDWIVEGQATPRPRLDSARLIVTDFDFIWSESGTVTQGTYAVGQDVQPWTIDLHFLDGPRGGETAHGIWRLDNGWLTLCLGLIGEPRPDDFTALPGSGRALQILTQDPREALPPTIGPLPPR